MFLRVCASSPSTRISFPGRSCIASIASRTGTKQETLYFLQNHGLSLDELNVIAVMDDAAALKRCIALGMGISILSRATVQTDAQQGRLLLFPLG